MNRKQVKSQLNVCIHLGKNKSFGLIKFHEVLTNNN